MLRQIITEIAAAACDNIEHAVRQASLIHDFSEKHRREWCQACRLDDDGITCKQCRCHLSLNLVQRIVPRCNACNDAETFFLDDCAVVQLVFKFEILYIFECCTHFFQ